MNRLLSENSSSPGVNSSSYFPRVFIQWPIRSPGTFLVSIHADTQLEFTGMVRETYIRATSLRQHEIRKPDLFQRIGISGLKNTLDTQPEIGNDQR